MFRSNLLIFQQKKKIKLVSLDDEKDNTIQTNLKKGWDSKFDIRMNHFFFFETKMHDDSPALLLLLVGTPQQQPMGDATAAATTTSLFVRPIVVVLILILILLICYLLFISMMQCATLYSRNFEIFFKVGQEATQTR